MALPVKTSPDYVVNNFSVDGGILRKKMDGTVQFLFRVYLDLLTNCYRYYLSLNSKHITMPKIHFDVNVINGVAFGVTHDALPVWWMKVYPVLLTNQNHCYMSLNEESNNKSIRMFWNWVSINEYWSIKNCWKWNVKPK